MVQLIFFFNYWGGVCYIFHVILVSKGLALNYFCSFFFGFTLVNYSLLHFLIGTGGSIQCTISYVQEHI
jgi:hypothetical protein